MNLLTKSVKAAPLDVKCGLRNTLQTRTGDVSLAWTLPSGGNQDTRSSCSIYYFYLGVLHLQICQLCLLESSSPSMSPTKCSFQHLSVCMVQMLQIYYTGE